MSEIPFLTFSPHRLTSYEFCKEVTRILPGLLLS